MFTPINICVNRAILKGDARSRVREEADGIVISWGAKGAKGAYQTAYILTLSADGKTIFASGRVETSAQECAVPAGVCPQGKKIEIGLTVFDGPGNESACAKERFYIGNTEWTAKWITSPFDADNHTLYFRRDFSVNKPVRQARLYACGLGYHEMYINGARVGDAHMDPAHTDYTKTNMYVLWPEVAQMLVMGENTVAARVAGGWRDNCGTYERNLGDRKIGFLGKRQLTASLVIEYEDGSCETLSTDDTWQAGTGASVFSHLFDGETYDANCKKSGWNKPGFAGFENAVYADAPGGKMRVMTLPCIKEMGVYRPVSISEPVPGKKIIDFGQNLSGVVRIKLSGLVKGQKITVTHTEEMDEDGLLYTACLREAKAQDTYIASGDENDLCVWQPEFTYHGFRYACVEGYDVDYEDIEAVLLHTDLESESFFRCGSAQINALHEQVVMTERDNMHSILTDCPQRDERMGWMNDATVRFEETPYNFDAAEMFKKIVRDLMDAQSEDGAITCTAPFVYGARPADPVCSSFLVAGMQANLHFGDREIIKEAYPAWRAWEDLLLSKSDDYIVSYSYYGDWAGPGYACDGGENGAVSAVTPGVFMSTGFSYMNCTLLCKMAEMLDKKEDAEKYARLAENIKNAILNKWYDAETATVATGSMACQAFALYLGILPKEDEPRAAKKMRDDLVKADYAFTTGNLCTRYMTDMLFKFGYANEAYTLLTRDEYPSFGYMRQQEATTVWERFELKKDPGMNSHNHPMYGAIGSTLYEYIAGVKPVEAGFKKFTVKPCMPDALLSAQAGIDTRYGRINVRWTKRYDSANLYVDVPFGAECAVEFMGQSHVWTSGTHVINVPTK